MADITKEVRIAFEGDDRVSKVISGISGSLDSFAGKIQGVTQPLANMADLVLKIEGALALLAAGGLALAAKKSIDFETATVSLSKILTDQEKTVIPQVQKEVLDLSNTFGQSSVAFLDSATDFKKAGFEINEVTGLLKDSATLVIAASEAELDLGRATEFVIATMKGFKAPAEDAGRLVDILNKVSNEYATNVVELATGMSKLSPVANQMGFSFEETAAVLTPVIEIFRSGDEAAVALRTGLLKLIDDAKPVQEGLAALGISQKDANGQLRSGKDILFDVAQAFQTADQDQKIFLAAQLVGIRQAAKMVEVFDGLTYTNEILATAMGATGSAANEVAARFETAQISVDRFIAGMENLGIAVGDQFREAAKEAIDGATLIENTLENMVRSGAFDPILDLVEQFAGNVANVLMEAAKNLPEAFENVDFSGLIDSLKDLGGEIEQLFEAFFGQIDLGSVKGLTDFIQKLVDGFEALTNVTAGILDALEPFVKQLGIMIEKFTSSEAETQKFVGQILGVGKAVNTILNNIGLLTGALDLLAGAVALLAITRIPALIPAFGSMGSAATGLLVILGKVTVAAAAFGAGWVIGDKLAESVPAVDKFGRGLADMALSFSGLDEKSILFVEDRANETLAAGKAAVAMAKLVSEIDAVPTDKEVAIDTDLRHFFSELDQAKFVLDNIPDQKDVAVTASPDKESITKAKDFIIREIPDSDVVEIIFNPDLATIDETKKALEEVPSEKIIIAELENRTQVQIETMKQEFALLQTAVEWKAKLDITEVTEHAENFRSTVDAISESFKNTGDVIIGLAAGLGDLSSSKFLDVIRLMEQESKRRDALLLIQKEQAQVEIDYIKAKSAALEKGEGFITIQMDGVYPELELVMHKIIERTQVRTNQEGLEFLLGV
jgi:TP901 family phage tail tape measure protein